MNRKDSILTDISINRRENSEFWKSEHIGRVRLGIGYAKIARLGCRGYGSWETKNSVLGNYRYLIGKKQINR